MFVRYVIIFILGCVQGGLIRDWYLSRTHNPFLEELIEREIAEWEKLFDKEVEKFKKNPKKIKDNQ